jgi:hypothetical protein
MMMMMMMMIAITITITMAITMIIVRGRRSRRRRLSLYGQIINNKYWTWITEKYNVNRMNRLNGRNATYIELTMPVLKKHIYVYKTHQRKRDLDKGPTAICSSYHHCYLENKCLLLGFSGDGNIFSAMETLRTICDMFIAAHGPSPERK